ncbi:MAG: hypothetical protein HOC71_13575 [Candidatus Latescibacteria bacterium]|jgi:hypothetical protein|nr:hypothetical protein [Candidatus Latescibacterota bacterium]
MAGKCTNHARLSADTKNGGAKFNPTEYRKTDENDTCDEFKRKKGNDSEKICKNCNSFEISN